MSISSFSGKYRFLSNFWLVTVHLDGVPYPSVEHAYQAAKFAPESELRALIHGAVSPARAKEIAKRNQDKMLPDYHEHKLPVMEALLREKFAHAHLRQQLLDTGEFPLIEGNTWGDTFWGVCKGVGQNHLGRLLMRIRADIA